MKPLASLPKLRSDLGQPNSRLDGFNLAEERSKAVEIVVTPVLKESFGLGRHKPVGRIRKLPPLVYLKAKIVND